MTAPQARRGGALAGMFRSIPVTMWLIVANLAMYAATAVQARSVMDNNRAGLFLDTTLYPPMVAIDEQWWRLITAAFEHFGPAHVLLNMYMLWILGLGVERSIGHLRYLAMYLVSALGGSAAVMVFAQNSNTAGASGAIFGLMGAYAIVALVLKVELRGILILIGLNVVMSLLVPNVSIAAHLGGLVTGALAAGAMVVMPRTLGPRAGRGAREAVSWGGCVLVAALTCWVAWYGAQHFDLLLRW